MVESNQPVPALILGDDPVNGLGVARNLGRGGIPVYRLGAADVELLRSRYIRAGLVVPGIEDMDDERYVSALIEAGGPLGDRPVLFPVTDLHVLKVAWNADRLAAHFRLTTSGLDSAEVLVNKRKFYETAERLGVPHPRTRFPTDAASFREAAREIGYPVLVKPEISPLFYRRFGKKGIVAHAPEELAEPMDAILDSGLAVTLQEIIPGDATCMCGINGYRRGDRAAWFCYRRVREFPAQLGCGSTLISVPSFIEETGLVRLLEHIGYQGIFDAELKRDPRDGRYKLIEINARCWWQNAHPARSGMNLVRMAYDDAVERLTDEDLERAAYRTGVKWIYLYHDFHAARSAGTGALAWLLSLRGPKAFAILAYDDPKPMARFLLGAVRRKG